MVIDFHRHLSERFLLDMDCPICPRIYVQVICQEPISRADRENILHKNAERILGVASK